VVQAFDCGIDGVGQPDWLEVEFQASGLDHRHVEHVVHQRLEPQRLARDGEQPAPSVVCAGPLDRRRALSEDGAQGRPQLV
jgi:hypothetical protein